jgi:hypothetical protein
MTDRTIEKGREPGSDYFRLYYSRKGGRELQFYLDQFDINDYWIYKGSNQFREVSIEDLYEFKYASYTLFKKDVYNKEIINNWIDIILSIDKSKFNYLIKPFPPEYVKDKIRIIK